MSRSWHRAAALSDLPQGQVRPLSLGGRRILVCRLGDDIVAVDDQCSHEAASLSEGFLDGDRLECPRHGAIFDLRTGEALTLPATSPIRCYPVRSEGGAVFIQVCENKEQSMEPAA